MANAESPGTAVEVCMTGGHGEWFFQTFSADGTPLAALVSLPPAEAIARSCAPVIAGSQSAAIAQARPGTLSLDLRPDAQRLMLLSASALHDDPRPSYGRAPDARLPTAA
jgi:hypothetical protein